ncbi:hypothetical protein P4O66_004489 [Electrophorus voltai]|uniref:acetate--CoA ligase n=1 Tax=Electrophorus voltai TaxID=2609070 RepID=A0AAD9DJY4_9TELE|nr:hypothetical protein P4O66_004489 [Electrophorus voltai]
MRGHRHSRRTQGATAERLCRAQVRRRHRSRNTPTRTGRAGASQIGAVATFRDVTVVAALPKTRSGKILRKTMRQIADNEEYRVPSTIEDASVLDELSKLLRG